jgi:hypothetical protein
MIAAEVETHTWSRRRWLAVIALALILQFGLIFWLGDRKTVRPMPAVKGTAMYLPTDQTADMPGLSDPTLFVLANRHGFSGPAWLKAPAIDYHLKEWTEPEPQPAPVPELGRTLNEFVRANVSRPFEVAAKPEPQMDSMDYLPTISLVATQSTFTIEGDLAARPLLSDFKLKSWPATVILTNSEVLVAVNPEGSVFSAVLLVKCGPKDDPAASDADASAVNLAKSARFRPLRWSGPGQPTVSSTRLTWGRMTFHWNTSALPATNAPPKTP